MATTYVYYDGSIAGQVVPPQHTPQEDRLFILRNIVDFSKQSLDAGLTDVGQVLSVPAGTTVLDAWLRVITAETANGTLDLGYGSDVDRWGNALAIDATGVAPRLIVATATWDAGSIDDGNEEAKEVTVDGAVLGDMASASLLVDIADLQLTADVTAANTVTCILSNSTGGAIDLASTTLTVWVSKTPYSMQPLYFGSADTIDVVATTDVADVDIDGAKIEVCALCLKSLATY